MEEACQTNAETRISEKIEPNQGKPTNQSCKIFQNSAYSPAGMSFDEVSEE